MKMLVLLILVCCLAFPSAAQEKCALALKDAPMLFGLKLGMSAEEVQSTFGKSLKVKVSKDGKGSFFQNYLKKPAPNSLKDVRALYLRFYDRKLYQIEIFYEATNRAETLQSVTDDFSAKLNLPRNLWENKRIKNQISCAEFSVVVDNVLNPRIELTDEIMRRKIENEEKQKKTESGK